MTRRALVDAAKAARAQAYAPYSNYHVGAALFCEDGSIICGCNVENASYGLTICAERNAIFAGVGQGRRNFVAMAIIGDGTRPAIPCGACLQVMSEFAPELTLYIGAAETDDIIETTVQALLPARFTLAKEEER
ncbi:MAG: cytidine deaminase [Peptococcaceae bacterium]|nr:cytidine deaminase [Peptococcaceae bacterium]